LLLNAWFKGGAGRGSIILIVFSKDSNEEYVNGSYGIAAAILAVLPPFPVYAYFVDALEYSGIYQTVEEKSVFWADTKLF